MCEPYLDSDKIKQLSISVRQVGKLGNRLDITVFVGLLKISAKL